MEHNPILKNPLSLDSEIPLYSQLMGIIKRSITSGALKVGDLLPSEAELCRSYDISRNTVRQAIGALEDFLDFYKSRTNQKEKFCKQ